ncbi:MAG: DUF2993 domain-containing protein [Leptolyngbyaceae cyanobacterium SL_7_1]|nr:DUF2993 domain-containing protein [Leptolyngbyaceae cyanobacterium SL_7_1]
MEFFTLVLSGVLSLLVPAGFVLDRLAANAIRDPLEDAEVLAVRIDNTPTHQLLQGRVDRVRIAGRGLFPLEGVRIAVAELETGAIAVDPADLRDGEITLEQPLNAAIRLVLDRADVNAALRSPEIQEYLEDLSFSLALTPETEGQEYEFIDPQIEFLADNRLRFQVVLRQEGTEEQIQIQAETGLTMVAGHQVQLIEPEVLINDQAIPPTFLVPLTEGLSRQFDLRRLEESGLTVRILQLQVNPDQLAIAAILRAEPDSVLLNSSEN